MVVAILKRFLVFSVALMIVSTGFSIALPGSTLPSLQRDFGTDTQALLSQADLNDYNQFSRGNFTGTSFSRVNLSVTLDDTRSTVYGSLSIEYHNDEPIAFSSIPFHLYPSGMNYTTRKGTLAIFNVTTIDTFKDPLSYDVVSEGEIMWVNLPAPVESGGTTSFQISFETTLPDGLDRANSQGSDIDQSRVFTFASCYPMPCVYDEYDGWNTDGYVDFGDPFYLDMAFYDFLVEVPSEMVVAATGQLIDSYSVGGNTTYHFSPSLPVREVTFSASRYYVVESMMVGSVNVSSFYIPDSQAEWEDDVLSWASEALLLFNTTYGIYPYSTLNVVEQFAFYGGMEYPCQVYMTNVILQLVRAEERPPYYLELVVVHEVVHQWWSQLVGVDSIDWGFLDEGMTSWSHNYFGECHHLSWEYFQYNRYLDNVRTFYIENGIDAAINQSNYDMPELVTYLEYVKTPLVLEKLRVEIGHEKFIEGLSLFLKQNYFRVGTLAGLQTALEEVCGWSLDWFFLPWFDNSRLPDYSFTGAVYDRVEGTLLVTIEDENEVYNTHSYSQQVPIRVLDSAHEILNDRVAWINGTTTLTLEVAREPDEVILLYDDYILVELAEQDIHSLSTRNIQIAGDIPLIVGLEVIAVIATIAIVVAWYIRRRES
ncbi:MAG: M1 family metallopeptidase [Candidatus Thorarchaeota archaeon]